jgi:hypothetical protein
MLLLELDKQSQFQFVFVWKLYLNFLEYYAIEA